MEYCGRRNRRARHRTSYQPIPMQFVQRPHTCDVLKTLCRFLFMIGLSVSLGVLAIVLCDYHCKICSKKCDLDIITRNINDMGLNISRLKDSYTDLEKSITRLADDKPKIDGQIEILQTLANSLEKGDFLWYPKTDLALPNVGGVFLNEPNLIIPEDADIKKNITKNIGQLHVPTVNGVEKEFDKNFTSID